MSPSGKPRVLVVTSTLPRWAGDSEPAFVLDLSRELSHRYHVIALAPHCRGAVPVEGGTLDVRHYRYFFQWGERLAYEGGMLPKLRRRPWLWVLVPFLMAGLTLAVARLLRHEPVDLVHAHWLVPQGLAVRVARILARSDVPLVCTAHGADVFGLRGATARALQRWVLRGCAVVGAVSTALGHELERRGADPARIRLLPMGVHVPDAVPPADERDRTLVAFAGRIVEKKGIGVLLTAFKTLAADLAGARLCIAGGGPDLGLYRRRCTELGLDGRVEFWGAVPRQRIEGLFSRAAVAVMPSLTAADGDSEGLGLVMIEAMATACPVVVTDLPAVRDVIRPGANGMVFPEGDAAALAAVLRRLLGDRQLAARLGAQARQDVRARYGWAAVATSHATAYGEALKSLERL